MPDDPDVTHDLEPEQVTRAASTRGQPTVGIGVPVYNGERYLGRTLDSVLAQTFGDFQVVIVDNASTDATADIATEYVAGDDRIRYYRNERTVGAARNHNIAFSLTRGRYFKWAAGDDVLDPLFLERCVEALEKDPGAVLAFPRARIIDADGAPVMDYAPPFATDDHAAATRFASMLEEHKCFQVYGLVRRSALEQTDLIGIYAHGDGVLLARLALLGRFVEIPEFLFMSRQHDEQSSRMIGDYWSYAVWFEPGFRRKLIFPHWRMFGEYAKAVVTAPIPVGDRAGALRELGRVLGDRWRLLRGDVLYHVRPKLVAAGVPERLLRRSTADRL